MTKPKVTIDVVSDVVCPWCYIGKRRLEKAIDQLKDTLEVEVHYHAFELNPNTPQSGFDHKKYLIEKFGSEERYQQLTDNVSSVAAQEGLHFNYALQTKSPNTLDAHRIIWYAGKEGKQLPVVEALFKAYFEQGIDMTKQENLVAIAAANGLDAEKVKELLTTDLGTQEVRERELVNSKIGITGVPFYIINNKYAVSGAQSTEVFLEALPDIASKELAQGEACDVDGENC